MSRSYWLPLFAVVGLLNFGSVLAKGTQQESATKQYPYATEQQQQAPYQIESWHPFFVDWLSAKFGVTGCGPYSVDRLGYSKERNESTYNDTCDLDAQESVANSTRWLLLIALLQTVLAIVGTLLVWRSLKLNRDAVSAAIDSNTIASNMGKAQTRAYLTCTNFEFGFRDDLIQVRVTIDNTGASPAKGIQLGGDIRYVTTIFEADKTPRKIVHRAFFNDQPCGDISGGGEGCGVILLIPKTDDIKTFKALLKHCDWLYAECQISWMDVFGDPQIACFSCGTDSGFNNPVLGSPAVNIISLTPFDITNTSLSPNRSHGFESRE
jgi:hypothetical protein